VEFRRYANANSSITARGGTPYGQDRDVFKGAPAPIWKPWLTFCSAKLYRRPIPRRVRPPLPADLNRRDIRQKMQLVRQIRGRKFVSGPEGREL